VKARAASRCGSGQQGQGWRVAGLEAIVRTGGIPPYILAAPADSANHCGTTWTVLVSWL